MEAFALAPSWLAANKTAFHFSKLPYNQTSLAIAESTLITANTDKLDIDVGVGVNWPNTTFRSNFFVHYSGIIPVTIAGPYTFYLTVTGGTTYAQCSINGAATVWSAPTAAATLPANATLWTRSRVSRCHWHQVCAADPAG